MKYDPLKRGRKPRHSDDAILDAIESHCCGTTTADALLLELRLSSKSTLFTRLRRMRDAGLISIHERQRHEGHIIMSNFTRR